MADYQNQEEITLMARYFPANNSNPSPAPAPRNFTLGRT